MRATHRNQKRRPPHRLGTFLAIALALVLGASAAGVAVVGLAATATVAYLSEDLPDPSRARVADVRPADDPLRPRRRGRAGSLPDRRAAGRRLRRRAPAGPRRDDHRGGPHVLGERRLRPARRSCPRSRRTRAAKVSAGHRRSPSSSSARGCSPTDVVAPGSDRYIRKAKEILQSMRLNETYPGVVGKERVITAYLNEIYYGHKAYGIAAAAKAYFGIEDLASLTPAQAALLASLPKSPSTLDPYAYAKKNKAGDLVVPADSPPVVRRNWVLSNLSTSRWTKLTPAELQDGARRTRRPRGRSARHGSARAISRGRSSASCQQIVGRGCRSHDGRLSRHHHARLAGTEAGTTLDHCRRHRPEPQAQLRRASCSSSSRSRAANAAGSVRCAARTSTTPRSWRSTTGPATCSPTSAAPGTTATTSPRSASNPSTTSLATASGSRVRRSSRSSTQQRSSRTGPHARAACCSTSRPQFNARRAWAPRDADRRDRGPVLVREALQQSLNIPAIRALERVGSKAVAKRARSDGHPLPGRREALSPGRPGRRARHGRGRTARPDVRFWHARQWWRPRPAADDPRGPRSRRLAGLEGAQTRGREGGVGPDRVPHERHPRRATATPRSTRPGAPCSRRRGPGGKRRPVAAKTGTAQDARDLATYGYLAPPKDKNKPGLAVGIWMGNSDHSLPRSARPGDLAHARQRRCGTRSSRSTRRSGRSPSSSARARS